MNKGIIRVVWLCHFSNYEVHKRLDLHHGWLMGLLRKMKHRSANSTVSEFANWITNGIKEFEKFKDVELHIISPYQDLKDNCQEFELNGIHYHFFKNEDDAAISLIFRRVIKPAFWKYKQNRKRISSLIKKIQPDVVHLIGAENPFYSLGLLDVPHSIVTITQLQTLLLDSDVKKNNPHFRMYEYRTDVERRVLEYTDYIGTPALKFRNIITNEICPSTIILNTGLPLKDPVVKDDNSKKLYDFVYFSSDLSKAADLAIEAFGLAFMQMPDITLDVIGGYNAAFKQKLDAIIRRYNLENSIVFEGRLPTHDDVLQQIRKSKYALLPLRSDLVSGTIREAMSNGLPVLTTDTGALGTQKLNVEAQCALISEIGNHQALAENILRLINDDKLAKTLQQNAYKKRIEAKSNEEISRGYVSAYRACLNHKNKGIPIPEELIKV